MTEERGVFRGPGGEYLGIDGLCGLSKEEAQAYCTKGYAKRAALLAVGTLAAGFVLRLAMGRRS